MEMKYQKVKGFSLPPGNHTWLPLPRGLTFPSPSPHPQSLLPAAHCFADALASCLPESITAIGSDYPPAPPHLCAHLELLHLPVLLDFWSSYPPRWSRSPPNPLARNNHCPRVLGVAGPWVDWAQQGGSGDGCVPPRLAVDVRGWAPPTQVWCPNGQALQLQAAPVSGWSLQHGSCAVPGLLPRLVAQDSRWRERWKDGAPGAVKVSHLVCPCLGSCGVLLRCCPPDSPKSLPSFQGGGR